MDAKESPQKSIPSSPTSGNSLAVLGSFAGAGSVLAASVGAGVGGAATTRIGTSGLGAGGGGGIEPVRFTV